MTLEELRALANSKITGANGEKKVRKRPGMEEHEMQVAAVNWFRYTRPELRLLLFSVPNGGRRDERTAALMKAEGAVAGVADLILLVPRGEWHGLAIEMKTAKGRQSESQKAWQKAVTRQGYLYVVCRSVDEFRGVVDRYLEGDETGGAAKDGCLVGPDCFGKSNVI